MLCPRLDPFRCFRRPSQVPHLAVVQVAVGDTVHTGEEVVSGALGLWLAFAAQQRVAGGQYAGHGCGAPRGFIKCVDRAAADALLGEWDQ